MSVPGTDDTGSLESPLRILLVRLRLIGDVVLTTPLLSALKSAFPLARLTYVVEPQAAPIVARNPHLEAVVVAPRRRGWRRVADDVRIAAGLRRQRFDVAIDLHGGPRSAWLVYASGAPRRVGYTIAGRTWMYTDAVDRPRGLRGRHSVENQWDLIARLHPSLARRPRRDTDPVEMPDDPTAAAKVAERLRAASLDQTATLVVIHVGAGNEFRRWPEEAFAELVAGLMATDTNRRIILTTGAGQTATARTVLDRAAGLAALPDGAVVAMCDLGLDELRALVGRAALFIGNDSGPMHIAATTPTPIVGLYGPTLAGTWAPWRDPSAVSELVDNGPLPCRPCDQRKCEPGDFRCLRRLPATRVIEAAERAMAGRARRI